MLATRKGVRREAGSEGSVVQTRGPTNRNRIRGTPVRTSRLQHAKSISIKISVCISGGGAGKVVGLTSGGLRRCPRRRTGEVERQPECDAAISRGRSRRRKRAGTREGERRRTHLAEGPNGAWPDHRAG